MKTIILALTVTLMLFSTAALARYGNHGTMNNMGTRNGMYQGSMAGSGCAMRGGGMMGRGMQGAQNYAMRGQGMQGPAMQNNQAAPARATNWRANPSYQGEVVDN